MVDQVLLEGGGWLLLETGDAALLESSPAALTPSQSFADVIAGSHRAVSVAEILDPEGVVVQTLTAITGSVSISATNARRRSMSLTIVDAAGDLTPTGLDSLLAPVTVEIRLRRGVEYADGTQELWPLGIFRVDTDDIAFTGGTIAMTGYDRSIRISRNRWLEPFVIEADTPSTAAIAAIARDRYPGVVIDMAPSDHAVTVETVFGTNTNNDPWADARNELGIPAGLDVFYDAAGALATSPFVDADQDLTVEFFTGAGGNVVGGARRLDGSSIKNGVMVVGQGADGSQIVAMRWDTNPDSPTYAGTPVGSSAFGADPFVYENKAITTHEQAVEVADLLLPKVLRLADSVQMRVLPDPRLDVNTICSIEVGNIQLDGKYVVQAISMPLDAGGLMEVQAGKVREMSVIG